VTEIREALFTVIAAYLQSSGTLSGVRGPVDGGLAVHAPDSELEHLSLAVAAARARSRLAFAPNRTIARSISTSPPALLLPDRAALDAQDLLCRVETARLAMCPPQQGGCGWVFLDHSRNRSRRWCAMDACGSGVKARRLTERRRTTRAAAL
jgi:predicted RNA-binding Zn ribbon-like protein